MALVTGAGDLFTSGPTGHAKAACHLTQQIVGGLFFPQQHYCLFICWPLFRLIKGIQFPSVAWWYSVSDTSGSVWSSERQRDAVECRRREGMHALVVNVCAEPDARLFRHSSVTADRCSRSRAWISLWLSCQALAASSPPSRFRCRGTSGSDQEFALERTLVGHR